MAKITPQQIEHLARLARVQLTPSQKKKLIADLSAILAYVAQLNSVDVKKISPAFHTQNLVNVVSDDEVRNNPIKEQLLAGASKEKDGYFKVKAVLE